VCTRLNCLVERSVKALYKKYRFDAEKDINLLVEVVAVNPWGACFKSFKEGFGSIVTPDGIVLHFFGPVEGRRHDLTLMRESKLDDLFADPRARGYHIYGDAAYPNRGYLISGYKGENLSPEEMQFNMLMSKCRESVEWGFKDSAVNWAFLDFHKNLKVLRCTPHSVQLPPKHYCLDVAKADSEVYAVISKARKIVSHFNHSSTSTAKLLEIAKDNNLRSTKLRRDNDTRWNSTHDMIGDVFTSARRLNIFDASCPGKIENLSSTEYELLAQIYWILDPFAEWMDAMQVSKENFIALDI
jgi:hypothetical protein